MKRGAEKGVIASAQKVKIGSFHINPIINHDNCNMQESMDRRCIRSRSRSKGADLGEKEKRRGEGRERKAKICGWRPWWCRAGVGTKFQRVKFQP